MDFRLDPIYPQITSALEQSRGLPSGLLNALVGTESSGNPNAVSPVGARGLTQFMPATAKQYNVDVSDPVDSLRGTADYLQDLVHQYGGSVPAALAHYNGGAANARFHVDGTVPSPQQVSPANHEVNKKYVNDIMSKLRPSMDSGAVKEVNAFVTELAKQGATPDLIINQLMQDPMTADLVSQGMKAGDSADQIVANLGGAGYAPIAAARSKVAGQSFIKNVSAGASNAVGDIAAGASQLGARITGNDERLSQLQQEQKAALSSPERMAQDETVGSKVGSGGVKALPYLAAAFVPGGLPTAIAAQGAAGAVEGALTPTTDDGQFTRNVLGKALLGAGTTGAAGLAGRLLGRAGGAVTGADAQGAERLALAEKNGLTPTVSMVNQRMGAVADAIPSARAVIDEQAGQDLSKQLLKGIGQEGTEITPAAIQAAQKGIYSEADTLLKGISVPRTTTGIGSALKDAVQEYEKNTLKTYRSAEVGDVAKDVLNKIKSGAMTGAGLVEARKNILANAFTTDGTTRQALKKIAGAIDDHLASIAPDASAALKQANQRWANLQVVENVYKRANGQTFTPQQLATSVKTVGKELFESGRAPYQDLADAALKLYGTNSGRSLAGLLTKKATGAGDGLLTGAAIFEPTTGLPLLAGKKLAEMLLKKTATSSNPSTVSKYATGPTQGAATSHYLAKALGSTASLLGSPR